MRAILRTVVFLAAAWLAFIAPAAGATVEVTFILTNDIDRFDGVNGRGGFARLAAVVRAERTARPGHVIFAHAGDMISPSLLSGIDKGAHTIAFMNATTPDVFAPGNHEYDFGPDIFRQRMGEAKFPVLAANLRDESGKQLPGISDTRMIEIGGVRIGIVGLTEDGSPTVSSPGMLQFSPTVKIARERAAELRGQGADFVVAVAHADREQDRDMVMSRDFDLILSGHDHDLTLFYDGRTALVESKEQAEFVSLVDVKFDVEEKDGKRAVKWYPGFRFIDTAAVTPDPEIQALVETYAAALAKELDVAIGSTSTALDSRRASVRTGEAAIGNLIADAIRSAQGADVAMTNGGGIRGNKEYAAGATLTRKDVLTELPFGNRTVKLALSGETLRAMLEHGFADLENAGGRFPQISGMSVVFDPDRPAGSRLVSVLVADKPLDPAATYTLATNDFTAAGGDGYAMLKEAKVLSNQRDAKLMANDVIAYIAEKGDIAPKIEGRIDAEP